MGKSLGLIGLVGVVGNIWIANTRATRMRYFQFKYTTLCIKKLERPKCFCKQQITFMKTTCLIYSGKNDRKNPDICYESIENKLHEKFV